MSFEIDRRAADIITETTIGKCVTTVEYFFFYYSPIQRKLSIGEFDVRFRFTPCARCGKMKSIEYTRNVSYLQDIDHP